MGGEGKKYTETVIDCTDSVCQMARLSHNNIRWRSEGSYGEVEGVNNENIKRK